MIPGQAVADIGTDHNYLPAYLLQNQLVPRAIASDIAVKPYQHARKFAQQLGLMDKLEVRLGQGLQVLKAGEVATIVIAGMGGYLIRDILAESLAIAKSAQRLVLQAQNQLPYLRGWLVEQGWQLKAEQFVAEPSQNYLLIAAEPGAMQLNALQQQFGPCLLEAGSMEYGRYLRQQKENLLALLEQIRHQGSSSSQPRYAQLQQQLDQLEQAIEQYFEEE